MLRYKPWHAPRRAGVGGVHYDTDAELLTLQCGADALFRALGCKLLQSPDGTVPIKDVATSDTLLLREPPAEDAVEARLPLPLTLTLPLPLTGAEDAVEARNRLASAPALALILA